MVDYFPVLDRAVAALNPNTKEARQVLYDRARRALVDGLRAGDPTLSDTDLTTQSAALEAAIRRVEAAAPQDPPPLSHQRPAAPPAGSAPPPRRFAPPPVQPPAPRAAAPGPAPSAPSMAPPVRAPVQAPIQASVQAPLSARAPEPAYEPEPEVPEEGYSDRPPLEDEARKPRSYVIAASVVAAMMLVSGLVLYVFWPSGLLTVQAPRATTSKRVDADVAGAAPYVYLRQPVYFRTNHPVGTIVVDKQQSFLYVVRPSLSALRYGIGVGPECNTAAGLYQIVNKEEWPGIKVAASRQVSDEERNKNPFGARALYLSKETRIHGTNAPATIGRPGSLGCFRLTNDDVIHLYERAPLETRVVVQN